MTQLAFRALYLFLFSSHLLTALAVSSLKKKNDLTEKSTKIEVLNSSFPVVINTWHFIEAGQKAWEVLSAGGSALDAVEEGCTVCEELQCDGTVGYGGSPDENGETTLDAMIMDGETHEVGAVADLRWVKSAISVARAVKDHTQHTLLAGSQATNFALSMGFPAANLTTPHSQSIFFDWKTANCQPNFWKNVQPNPSESCGPYHPLPSRAGPHKWQNSPPKSRPPINRNSHDTIGMVAIDMTGCIAGGTSTNGANHKIPGRVGDSPIPGSGAYVDKKAGGAAATGDGDVMMRFMPSLIAVEAMRQGLSPKKAAESALKRIVEYYPTFSGAIVTLSIKGEVGASCNNIPGDLFPYTVRTNAGIEARAEPCL